MTRMVHFGTNVLDLNAKNVRVLYNGDQRDLADLIDNGIFDVVGDQLVLPDDYCIEINCNGRKHYVSVKDRKLQDKHLLRLDKNFLEQNALNESYKPSNTPIVFEIDVDGMVGGGGPHNAAYWAQQLYNWMNTNNFLERHDDLKTLENLLVVLDGDPRIEGGLRKPTGYHCLRDGNNISVNVVFNVLGYGTVNLRSPLNLMHLKDIDKAKEELENIVNQKDNSNEVYFLPNSVRDINLLSIMHRIMPVNDWKKNFLLSLTDSMIKELDKEDLEYLIKRSSLVLMNRKELDILYDKLYGEGESKQYELEAKMKQIQGMMDNEIEEKVVCITQDKEGATIYDGTGYVSKMPDITSKADNTNGAGDAFFGAFTLLYAICQTKEWVPNYEKILEISNEVAQKSIEQDGAVGKPDYTLKLTTLQSLEEIRKQKIDFTSPSPTYSRIAT